MLEISYSLTLYKMNQYFSYQLASSSVADRTTLSLSNPGMQLNTSSRLSPEFSVKQTDEQIKKETNISSTATTTKLEIK